MSEYECSVCECQLHGGNETACNECDERCCEECAVSTDDGDICNTCMEERAKQDTERYVCIWNMCFGMGQTYIKALKRMCKEAGVNPNHLHGKVGVYHIKSEIPMAPLDKEAKPWESYVYVNEMGGICIAPSDKVKVDSISLDFGGSR